MMDVGVFRGVVHVINDCLPYSRVLFHFDQRDGVCRRRSRRRPARLRAAEGNPLPGGQSLHARKGCARQGALFRDQAVGCAEHELRFVSQSFFRLGSADENAGWGRGCQSRPAGADDLEHRLGPPSVLGRPCCDRRRTGDWSDPGTGRDEPRARRGRRAIESHSGL